MEALENGGNPESHKLDLSGQSIKKLLPLHYRESQKITSLHLDNNELQKLEHVEKFSLVVELSASHNQIVRMYPVSHLVHLVRLDLSYNTILTMEGFKPLVHLKYLNLASNKIKNIERLQNNVNLEHLDLSENSISGLSNMSELRNLKKLFLHKNLINQLRHAELYLPKSLVTLTLAGNRIIDLCEVSRLVDLPNLNELSFVNNPCVEQFMGNCISFDYRPYLINWCIELKTIDGFVIDDIERLKGEWLYSQGRGRKFKPGQHNELVKYLMETCPINNVTLMTESERKLRLILSKAHQHQKQLKMSQQPGVEKTGNSELMTRSLDNSLLESCSPRQDYYPSAKSSTHNSLTRSLCETLGSGSDDSGNSYKTCVSRHPLPAATKLVPVPESLVSPLVSNPPPISMPVSNDTVTPDEVSDDKLQTIKQLALVKREEKTGSHTKELAAVCIQRYWRGYRTRKLQPFVSSMHQHLQVKRTNDHIHKLSQDVLSIRLALDNEHKLHVLQMQATKALWKKVQELQTCMQEVIRCVSPNSSTTISTQTDAITSQEIDKQELS